VKWWKTKARHRERTRSAVWNTRYGHDAVILEAEKQNWRQLRSVWFRATAAMSRKNIVRRMLAQLRTPDLSYEPLTSATNPWPQLRTPDLSYEPLTAAIGLKINLVQRAFPLCLRDFCSYVQEVKQNAAKQPKKVESNQMFLVVSKTWFYVEEATKSNFLTSRNQQTCIWQKLIIRCKVIVTEIVCIPGND